LQTNSFYWITKNLIPRGFIEHRTFSTEAAMRANNELQLKQTLVDGKITKGQILGSCFEPKIL
jgi:hypothetical protein